MSTEHTPLPWWIRKHPHDPDQFVVVAKPTPDHPYHGVSTTVDILGEEDYPRKRADAELVVRTVNSYARLLRELQNLVDAVDNDLLPKGDFPGVPSAVARAKNAIRDAKTLPTAQESKANTGQ